MHNTKRALEKLILVDEYGRRLGVAERCAAHQGRGRRHRAFVIFLVRADGSLLVQKRARCKLGGGRWDVSATSHVRDGETFPAAIERCLQHELGVVLGVKPRFLLAYTYQEQLGKESENEHCSLFAVNYDGPISLNAQEVEDIDYFSMEDLQRAFERDAGRFTRWFTEAYTRMVRHPHGTMKMT